MSTDDQSQPNKTLDEIEAVWADLTRSLVQEELKELLPKLKEEIKAELRTELLKQDEVDSIQASIFEKEVKDRSDA